MPGDRPSLRSPVADEGGGAPAAGAVDLDAAGAPHSAQSWSSWRTLWQVPTIVISVGLIVMGLRSAIRPPMEHDFQGALDQVEQFIVAGQLDEAYSQMRDVLEPKLAVATMPQKARFHAASADFTYASQQKTSQHSQTNNRHIVQQYEVAEGFGLEFSPVRRERWGEALLALGEIDAAESQLQELKRLASGGSGEATTQIAEDHTSSHESALPPTDHAHATSASDGSAAVQSYGRLFQHMIGALLKQQQIDTSRVMQMLAEYRMSVPLDHPQRAWVAARLAELRLETGEPDDAISGLLVEMRRLEAEHVADHSNGFGELYLLLARAHHEIGETLTARDHLERAQALLRPSDPLRGEALVLLGRIAMAQGADDQAAEYFNTVVNEFVGTPSYLPGLLGKAECESTAGDHASAQADFREVATLTRSGSPRRDVTPSIVAQRLCDRHDASLATGRTERALEYAVIAESLFEPDDVPPDVLIRKASTNRQLADDLLAAMGSANANREVDPAVRFEVNRRFDEAGEDYLRHAASNRSEPLNDGEWAASLWLAADCFDRGGRHRRAIETFERYLGSRPPDDARRAEGMYRVAQAYEALMDYEQAAHAYQQVRDDRARTSFAAQCHVPLARCYRALDRLEEARRTLEEVVSGQRLLTPDAQEYREALLELGRLHHDQREFVPAVERLAEAIKRYPDDGRLPETRYLLADSYRGLAQEIDQRLRQDTGLSPAESTRLNDLKREHLRQAGEMFAQVAGEFSPQPGRVVASHIEDLARRSHLYRADCAFELEQYEQAVDLYESASRLYSTAASSMYALVQIVNCYAALGDAERASAAHQRALLRLQQLPESAFASPDALMDRTAWERWLRNSPLGGGSVKYAEAESASG